MTSDGHSRQDAPAPLSRCCVAAASSLAAGHAGAVRRSCMLNAVKSPGGVLRERPAAACPTGSTSTGSTTSGSGSTSAQKLLNSVLISGSVAVLAVVAVAAQRLRARHRPGQGPDSGSLAFFLLANMLPQEALVYPLYYLAKEVGLYDTRLARDHHLHRDPERLRHLPALLGARHASRARSSRRRGSTARASGRCCGGSSCPISRPTLGGAARLLLHLDLERVLPPAGHADLQRQPDRAGGARRRCRATG